MFLCKKKYLDYSIKRGLSLGENFEPVAKKIAPKDLSALSKVIKKVDETGGVQNLKRIR
jgi:hypothetical protein